mmetsp:Transcript_1437/g.1719  ORF Transcript_1437/g.1719 Transcript_1437/m.1719 type:complete len:226 (-) Transcript_1437:1999-2676(-)
MGMNSKNKAAVELYNQFLLDIPRLDIFVDGKKNEKDSTTLFMHLWQVFRGSDENNSHSFQSWDVSPLNFAWTYFQLSDVERKGVKGKLSPNNKAIRALNYCTQTALASWFAAGREQWCAQDQGLHLVDGGRQKVEVKTLKNKRSISVHKPFRIIRMSDSCDVTDLSLVNLSIFFDAETEETATAWCIMDNGKAELLDKRTLNLDWVLVEASDIPSAETDQLGTTS